MKRMRRIFVHTIMIPVMLLFLLAIGSVEATYANNFALNEDDPLPPPSEETVLGDMEFELEPGENMIPMHGSRAVKYFRNLNFVEQEDCPVTMIAMKEWYYLDENSKWNRIFPNNDASEDYRYDCRTEYMLELQVHIPETVGYTTYSLAEDATLTIGGYTFTLYSVNGELAHFRCDGFYPRYLRVEGIVVDDDNKDDVLGDEDTGSTVSYDPSLNVLTLNNTHLVFDEKSCAQSVTDEYERAAAIFAVNTDLNINVEGENSIAPGKGNLTEEPYINAISQAYTNGKKYSINIEGSGSLSISLSGDDSYYDPKVFLYGINGRAVNISGVRLTMTLINANYAEGILALDEVTIGGKADVRIYDQNISERLRGIDHGIEVPVTIKEGSILVVESTAPQSVGIDTNTDVEFMDDSVVSLIAGKVAIAAKSCKFTNYSDISALVNGEASEIGRTVWDGMSVLNSSSYKYVRIPGLTHVEAVPATTTESGNIEYYYDELLDKYYSDAEGSKEIAKEDTVIEPTGGEDPVDPTPVDPTPVDPTPIDPTPIDPTPVDPTPVDPTPIDPTPVDPTPTPAVTPAVPIAPAEIVDLPAVKISKPKAAKKAATVKWKKVSKKNQKKIQGIEIQVATDAGFTNIVKTATASKKKTSKKIKGLTSKKTCYVRIRAYRNAADGKHVSAWKTKKVKIK